jgi:hypothetical protein
MKVIVDRTENVGKWRGFFDCTECESTLEVEYADLVLDDGAYMFTCPICRYTNRVKASRVPSTPEV